MTTRPATVRALSLASMIAACLTVSVLMMFSGCQTPPEDDAAQSESTEGELTRPGPQFCGSKLCPTGQVCCNASCGICVPRGGFCTQQFCGPVGGDEDDVGSGGKCETDADCRLVSDYCGGCNCRALSAHGRLPVCTRARVACYANPCKQGLARCENGMCRLGPLFR
jgi:hypothetical protein